MTAKPMLHSSIATALLLLAQIDTGSAQTCGGYSNFVAANTFDMCPATRSCKTAAGCCGSCTGASECYAYTCGNTCQDTPCSPCGANYVPLPSDNTGSRLMSGVCPATNPHKTGDGCCAACLIGTTPWAYDCGGTCRDTYQAGCTGGIPATARPPPPSPLPPPRVVAVVLPPPPPSPVARGGTLAQTCPSTFVGSENYLIASSAGTCDSATRSCKKDNCCGSCFSISDADKILREKGLPYMGLHLRRQVPGHPVRRLHRSLHPTPYRRHRQPSVSRKRMPGQQAPQDNGRMLWSLQG